MERALESTWRLDGPDILAFQPPQDLRPFAGPQTTEASTRNSRLKLSFSAARRPGRLDFSFSLSGGSPGDLQQLVVPTPLEAEARKRKDELWKSTCLEIFVGPANGSAYLEMNMSPSGNWNLYAFDDYRKGMRAVSDARGPLIDHEASSRGDLLAWRGSLATSEEAESGELAALLSAPSLVMGVTAVLEYGTGEREYWAIVHAGDKPDFHLRESFRLTF